jgi:hypothetical protein
MKEIYSSNLIDNKILKVTESSIFKGLFPASYLLNQTKSLAWGDCGDDIYFDIDFGRKQIELTGYSIMAYANDDDALRNWDVLCMPNEEVISRKQNDKTLCPNAKQKVNCGSYDVAYFEVDRVQKCRKLRLKLTGPSATGGKCIDISAIELFGKVFFHSCSISLRERRHFLFTVIGFIIN